MIADLHAHYPMHVRPEGGAVRALLAPGDRGRTALELLDGLVVGGASRLWNYESPRSGPRATVEGMRAGGVGVALSVLYLPLLEMGERFTVPYRRRHPYGAPPAAHFFPALLRQLELIERRVAARHPLTAMIARSPDELDAGVAAGKLVLVHCVEGGFQLGSTAEAVDDAVTQLAHRGVAYVTLAHLVWRHVATNEPAVPFLGPRAYRRLFLVDVSHMSEHALDDTFELLDEVDPGGALPVIASHVAVRFGNQTYNLDSRTIARTAARGGLIGLILAEHQATDGLQRERTRSFEHSFAVLARHIDRIHEITGSHCHTAIGSDLDGFIKPTLSGLADMRSLGRLEAKLREHYGEAGDLIASGNVLRVLRSGWGGKNLSGIS